MTAPSKLWPWWLTLSVVLPFVLYAWTASPGPYWLDSGEFVASTWTLGIPHAPGHPLYTALSSGATLWPTGPVAWRVNLFSALCAALSCGVLAWSSRRLLWRLHLRNKRAEVVSMLGALLASGSYALWFQAVRAEVYTLHLLTVTVLVALGLEMEAATDEDKPADPRLLYTLALVLGLSLANHHYLTIFVAVPLLGLLLGRGIWRRCLLSWHGLRGVGLGLLGLSTYLLLPLRAARDPLVNWGDPSTWSNFWWVLSAQDFQKTLSHGDTGVQLGDVIAKLGLAILQQYTPLGVMAALVGLFWLLKSSQSRGAGMLLGSLLACNLMTQSLFGTFDPFNPDAYGYFALSAWLLALLCVCAWGVWHQMASNIRMADPAQTPVVRRGLSWVGALALAALLVVNTWLTWPQARLDSFHDVDIATGALLDPLPEGSLVLSSNYKTLFNLWYAQAVQHQRPDVLILHRNFFSKDSYVAQVQRRTPATMEVMAAPGQNNRVNVDALRKMARSGPVFVEYDSNIQEDLPPFLSPEGMLFRVNPEPLPAGDLPEGLHKRQEAHWRGLVAHLASRQHGETLEQETARHILWQHYQMARGLLASGRLAMARFHVEEALKLNPRSPELQTMLRDIQKR